MPSTACTSTIQCKSTAVEPPCALVNPIRYVQSERTGGAGVDGGAAKSAVQLSSRLFTSPGNLSRQPGRAKGVHM
eukprot:15472905-Alexandrium_andersonii.AAC.1